MQVGSTGPIAPSPAEFRSKAKTTAAFRTRLKDALMAVNAEGFGRALIAAGTPMGGWVHAPDDADLGSWDVEY